MKKIISILMILMMSFSLLTACAPTTHKVEFWVDNSIMTTYEEEEGETVVVPIATNKADYEFEYWLLDGTTTQYQPGDTITVGNSDIKIVAIYAPIPKYSVSFYDGNTLIFENTGLLSGANAVAPAGPSKAGYTFVAWEIENTSTRYIAGQFVSVSNANIKLVAVYDALPTYTVSFYNGTEVVSSTAGLYAGESAVAPAGPSKPGYTFVGWRVENTTTVYQVGDEITVNDTNIKLVAVYDALPTYTVSFYNGTEVVSSTAGLYAGESAVAPAGPSKLGYTFVGWKVENTTTVYQAGDEIIVNDTNIKLVAEYEQDLANYTLSFYVDGVVVDSDSYEYGHVFTMPTAPSKLGYIFSGWQLIGGEQTVYQAGDTLTVDEDMIFAGYYVEDTSDDIRVIFRVDGVRYEVNYYELGETLVWPTAPVSQDKTFVGWQEETSGTIYTQDDTLVVEDALNFVAVFSDAINMAIYNEIDNYYEDSDPYKELVMDVVLGNLPRELYSSVGEISHLNGGKTTTYTTVPSESAFIPSRTVQKTGNVYVQGDVTVEFFTFKTDPIYTKGMWTDDNYISGYLAYPTGAKSGDNLPGILLMHGGGGAAISMVSSGMKMAAKGYVVVSVDEPGVANPLSNVTDTSSGSWLEIGYGAHRMRMSIDGEINVKASTLYTATATAIRAFSILYNSPLVDNTKLGLTGMSWGGYLTTYLTGALGSMVEAASSCWGCGFFEEEGNFDTELKALPKDEYDAFIKYLDAGRRADNAKANFFLGAANNDNWFRPQMLMNTLEAMTNVKSKTWFFAPNKNHNADDVPGGTGQGGMGSFLSDDYFFDYYLKGEGSAPSQIKFTEEPKVSSDGNSIIVNVDITVPQGLTLNSKYTRFYYSLMPNSGKWIDRVYVDYSANMTLLSQVGNTYYYQVILEGDLTVDGVVFYASISDSRPFTVSTMMKSTTGMIDRKVYNEVASSGGVSVSTTMADNVSITSDDFVIEGSVAGADKVRVSVGFQTADIDVVGGTYSANLTKLFSLDEDKTYTVSVRPLVGGEVVKVDEDTLVGVSRTFTYDMRLNVIYMTGSTEHTLNINTQGNLKVTLNDDIISQLVGDCTMRVTTYKLEQVKETKTLTITLESVSPAITVSVTDNNGQDIPPSDWVVVVEILDANGEVLRSTSIESGLKGGYIT